MGDDLALPVAARAGARDREKALLKADLAAAAALAAVLRLSAGFGTRAFAGVATDGLRDRDDLLATKSGFFESDVDRGPEIRARSARATACAAASACSTALGSPTSKDVAKNVPEDIVD